MGKFCNKAGRSRDDHVSSALHLSGQAESSAKGYRGILGVDVYFQSSCYSIGKEENGCRKLDSSSRNPGRRPHAVKHHAQRINCFLAQRMSIGNWNFNINFNTSID